MGLGWKLALAGACVYLAIPIVRRLANGCPAFAASDAKQVPVVGGGTTPVVACHGMTAADLFLWPVGLVLPGPK